MVSFQSCVLKVFRQDWFWNHTFPQFREKRVDAYAAILAKALHDQPRESIALAQNNKKVLAARTFLKNLTVSTEQSKTLKSELLAVKLGLTREIFDANPGFEEFVAKYRLERYLLEYKHTLRIDDEKKVWIQFEEGGISVFKKWGEVSTAFERCQKRSGRPSQQWIYGPLGIQNKDMYDWKELMPYKREDPSQWCSKYIFEVCVFLTGSPRSLTGNHSWLRLRTPEGDVYSVGLYRTGKRGAHQHWKKPLRVMPGELMSPDVSEFWPGEVRSLQIAITQTAFEDVKRSIEAEKRKGQQPFEDFDQNCTRWVAEKAKVAGVTLNASENLVTLFFLPRKVEQVARKVWDYIPAKRFLETIGKVIAAFSVNVLQLALGAGSVDPALSDRFLQPRIPSFIEVFNSKKMVVYHPYTLADKTMVEITSWRAKERERVLHGDSPEKEKELQRILYAVP